MNFLARDFVWRVLDRAAKRRACISQAPAEVPFEVFSDFLRPQTQMSIGIAEIFQKNFRIFDTDF